MKRASTITYIFLIASILLFAVGCNPSNKPNVPPAGQVKVEIFALDGGEYVDKGEETLFENYSTPGKKLLIAILQVKNTGSLLCDYNLSISAEPLPESIGEESIEIFAAQFELVPESIADAVKNGEFENYGKLLSSGTEVSNGTLKVGKAAYIAIMLNLPDEADEQLGEELSKIITVNLSAEEHTAEIPDDTKVVPNEN